MSTAHRAYTRLVRELTEAAGYSLTQLLQLAACGQLSALAPRVLLKLQLPMGLRAYTPLKLLPDALKNALHVFYYRDYEALLSFRPREGWVVVDVGAFIGLYTLRAAKLIGKEGFVLSLEPLPESYSLLTLNVQANGLHNVKALGACAWMGWGVKELYVPESPLNASLRSDYAESCGGLTSARRVRCIPLDAVLEVAGCVDLLKLDVEGVELELLCSSKLVVPNRVRKVVVEAHPPFSSAREVAGELEGRGYRTLVYLPEGTAAQAFVYAF